MSDQRVPFWETFYEDRHDHHRTPYMFNGKELDKETGLYYYGARYYDPQISMFYGVDPIADKFPHVSGYNYAENSPVSNIDLWGLQKVYFSYALDQNKSFRKIYNTQRKTSGGKKFSKLLKQQKKYDVYYYIYNSNATEGRVVNVKSKSDFIDQRKKINDLKSLTEDELDGLFEEGKNILLIGIDQNYAKDENNDQKINSGTKVLNHEEVAHGTDYLDDGENNNTSQQDHEKYFGESSYTTPEDSEIQTQDKYKNTVAKKQLDEIDVLLEIE